MIVAAEFVAKFVRVVEHEIKQRFVVFNLLLISLGSVARFDDAGHMNDRVHTIDQAMQGGAVFEIAEHDLQGLMRDAGEGAGDDQADAGASIFGREYEMSLVANSRDKLDQVEHALERLANGTYGVCESCGNPIGKLRLQAAPRATLCMACKTRQEHR